MNNSSGTTDTESFTPFTGGGGGGGATSGPMKDGALDSSPFRVGEKVLAFHGPCLYDAKVQKLEFRMGEWRCHIHYIGWKKHWDEWLDVDSLLKHNDENVLKQEELRKEHGLEKIGKHGRLSQEKTKSSNGPKGKKRELEIFEKDECLVPQENVLNIQIPSTLKKQLVDDHEYIFHLGQLVKLPRTPSVYEILNQYRDYRVNKDGMTSEPVLEMVEGLRYYFDKALPAILLYKEERQQYEEVIVNDISPSFVYGAQHLLRLFVKLPKMLSGMNIEMKTQMELQEKLMDFLRFLQNNESAYFHSSYQKSEGFVAVVKEEENKESSVDLYH